MKFRKLVTICLTLFFISTPAVFSMMVGNTGELFFFTEDGPNAIGHNKLHNESIQSLIIKSAAYFLKGKAHVDWLASELEISELEGLSFYNYYITSDTAKRNMEKSRDYYQQLTNRMETAPYTHYVERLKDFDYNSFARENGLNGTVFDFLKDFLSRGDVRGAFFQLQNYTDNIITMLDLIQNSIIYLQLPELSDIWRLNQECCKMHLFGQYMAQVFY
ncbi:MAG: hypothetical protein GY710_16010, partial [Desulfobacteraceae bacterium]|nr:hypothetical protein [Desulfobacteraceae bacterium]